LSKHKISTAKDCVIIETDQLCIDKEAQDVNIEKLQKGEENDIALIEMEEYVEFSLLVSRICLATEDNFDRVKRKAMKSLVVSGCFKVSKIPQFRPETYLGRKGIWL
jgi:hypothetical protein